MDDTANKIENVLEAVERKLRSISMRCSEKKREIMENFSKAKKAAIKETRRQWPEREHQQPGK